MKIEKEKPSFNFEEFKNQAIADMKAGKSLVGKDGVFTPLMKEFLEVALEGEMHSHMASCLEDPENQNRRNGKTAKTIQSPMGAFELETPRDREGSFEPQIVKKRAFKELCQELHTETQVESSFKIYMKLRNGQCPILQRGYPSGLRRRSI